MLSFPTTRRAAARLGGVRDVKANHRKQTIRLGFDERRLDEEGDLRLWCWYRGVLLGTRGA